jgi:alkanesulfonate monooxygenase SsuD/methylene tetrahydromethanopterin reductase-like flavin-dependent oxidoreductase (luciferase family)
MTLSHVAAVTSRIKLGTSVLVLPTRQPVVLAKEIATLQHLSGGRFIYGVGTGWYPPEFDSTGSTKQQRGARTDEVLEASMQLLKDGHVTFEGTYYRMSDITIEPLTHVPPVWVAGGAQYAHEASPDQPEMSAKVLARICRWDGWIARPTAAPAQIAGDLAEIDSELGRMGTTRARKRFTVAHENFCWLSEKASKSAAVDEQKRYMMAVVSDERPWDYIEAVYLTGTIDDVQRRIQERIDAGVEEVFLHTMTPDLHQLDLFAKHILEPFARVHA